ncbi:MAG: four helix bundle protein [Lentimonas sp.]
MSEVFDHEKLKVYQRSLDFVEYAEGLLANLPKGLAAYDQLDRASTSIPLNIAEGNGKFTAKDRCRFFDIARGSALECAAVLDVLLRKGKLEAERGVLGKEILREVVSMLIGLIRSQKADRVYEESTGYNTED